MTEQHPDTIRERVSFDSIRAFLDRVARDDLSVFALAASSVGDPE